MGIRDYVGHFKTLNETERRANNSDKRDGEDAKGHKDGPPPEPSMAQVFHYFSQTGMHCRLQTFGVVQTVIILDWCLNLVSFCL